MAKRAANAATPRVRQPLSTASPPQSKTRRWAKAAVPAPTPVAAPHATGMQLYTVEGVRKYLTAAERDAFLDVAQCGDRAIQTLCMTVAYRGCRLSEPLALTVDRIDLGAGMVVFESLKKCRDGIYRAMLAPPA